MKSLRFLFAVAAVLTVAFLVNRQPVAQTASVADDRGALGQYERLELSLLKRGDTNTANEVARLVGALNEARDATDVVTTVRILQSLRSGKTNDAIQLLECHLNGALLCFGAPSTRPRDTKYDKILEMAKEYRAKLKYSPKIRPMVKLRKSHWNEEKNSDKRTNAQAAQRGV